MSEMVAAFIRLNEGWNAEPNAPNENVRIDGNDLILQFRLNPFQFEGFDENDNGILRFTNCSRFRLGVTNDEGWYRGECRFSRLAPSWGEFYAVLNDPSSIAGPDDWVEMPLSILQSGTHFLFYFRDRTFECVAENCAIEPNRENALFREAKLLLSFAPKTGLVPVLR